MSINSIKQISDEDIANELGLPVEYIARLRKSSNGKQERVGKKGERIISEKLREMGLENNLMADGAPFDILLSNGLRIDVKTAFQKYNPPSMKTLTKGIYHFDTSTAHGRNTQSDFYICYLIEFDVCFVVPRRETRNSMIAFTYPPGQKKSKYHQYEGRFDLLKKE